MAFNGSEGGQISLEHGADMTARYRTRNENETIAHFFGRDILEQLLAQEGCVGIRMYYGIDEHDEKQLVLVGVRANQDDILEIVADLSSPCPILCSKPNPLNGL